MPEISRFFGIVIRMFFGGVPGTGRREHPPAHVHVAYRTAQETMDLLTYEFTPQAGYGRLSARAKNLAREWAEMHREELLDAWSRAQANIAPLPWIPGLDDE